MFRVNSQLRNTFARRGVFATPDPRKAHGTEDAFFACDTALAVADGVGGWGSQGVNAGLFARSIMSGALQFVKEQPPNKLPTALQLLDAGYRHVLEEKLKGSAPVVCCSLVASGTKLSINNLGDCAVMILRDDRVVYRSTELQHRFNCPYQLSSRGDGSDTPAHGEMAEVSVADGDVIILASDGVFDNIEDDVAQEIVKRHVKQSAEWRCAAVAEEIGHAAVKASKYTRGLLPFGRRALEQTGRGYDGGKVDDITVLVARVCDKNHPVKETCASTMDEVIPVKPMKTKKSLFGW